MMTSTISSRWPVRAASSTGSSAFEAVLQVLGDAQKGAFGQRAGQVHDDDRKFGEVDLVDRVLVGAGGELRFGVVHARRGRRP